MRILLVQRNEAEASGNVRMLSSAGFIVDHVNKAAESLAFLLEYQFNIILLDHPLPDMDGCLLIDRIRARNIDTPILMLIDRGVPNLVVKALHAGADDVLAKPLHHDEFIARIRSIIRRCNGHAHPTLQVGPMKIDMDSHDVFVGGHRLDVTNKEFEVLQILALRRGKVMTTQNILSCIYDGLDDPAGDIVRVFICNLRKKMAAFNLPRLIDTARGSGYVIRDDSNSDSIFRGGIGPDNPAYHATSH